ncbi:MAG: hypothetical protein D3925_02485 [Candidatus Electrothrix sp. AR5]|nr:hypothetical protein [Candidatus Electrothrix sp. AR5]
MTPQGCFSSVATLRLTPIFPDLSKRLEKEQPDRVGLACGVAAKPKIFPLPPPTRVRRTSGNCRLEEVIGYLALVLGEKRYHPEFPERGSTIPAKGSILQNMNATSSIWRHTEKSSLSMKKIACKADLYRALRNG